MLDSLRRRQLVIGEPPFTAGEAQEVYQRILAVNYEVPDDGSKRGVPQLYTTLW